MYKRIILNISYLRCTKGSFSLSLISDVQPDQRQAGGVADPRTQARPGPLRRRDALPEQRR